MTIRKSVINLNKAFRHTYAIDSMAFCIVVVPYLKSYEHLSVKFVRCAFAANLAVIKSETNALHNPTYGGNSA